jgi:peroxiredoxin
MRNILSVSVLLVSIALRAQTTIPLEIEVMDVDGNTLQTSEITLDSEFIILDFWNVGCKPCMIQLKSFAQHYDELKARGIEVLAISTFPPSAASEKLIEKYQWPFPVYYDTTKKFFNKYSRFSVTLPLTLIFDKHWNLVYKAKGAPVKVVGEDGELFFDANLIMEYTGSGEYEKLDLDFEKYYQAIEQYKLKNQRSYK